MVNTHHRTLNSNVEVIVENASVPNSSQSVEHRDFPRLNVEAKVRIAGTAPAKDSQDQPAVVSDLSLGGARLSTPANLAKGARIGLIPFTGLLEDHPLHRVLEFDVVWAAAGRTNASEGGEWLEYGLLHQGSVLDVLNSWLGHLLLRRESEAASNETVAQERRLHFKPDSEPPMRAVLSHDSRCFEWTLLDLAPGGLLARGDGDDIPVGVHLEIRSGWDADGDEHDLCSLLGCVVDAHSHSGSTFYRVAFDPDSELDDEQLVNWAESVGGQLEY